jgi:thioesterase domain-containing protein
MAQQLTADGEDVALLALVDPVGMDSNNPQRFGHRALWARSRRDSVRKLVRLGGQLRAAVPKALRERRSAKNVNDWAPSHTEFQALELWAKTDRENIIRFSALLELNTGQPFAISNSELDSIEPSAYLDFLLARVAEVDASIDADLITRILIQYDLQARSQHRYRLQQYDRSVHLFEAAGRDSGLIAAQLRPYVRSLFARSLALDGLSDRTRELLEPFPEGLRVHFSCMRNNTFAEGLAAELDAALELSAGALQ